MQFSLVSFSPAVQRSKTLPEPALLWSTLGAWASSPSCLVLSSVSPELKGLSAARQHQMLGFLKGVDLLREPFGNANTKCHCLNLPGQYHESCSILKQKMMPPGASSPACARFLTVTREPLSRHSSWCCQRLCSLWVQSQRWESFLSPAGFSSVLGSRAICCGFVRSLSHEDPLCSFLP